MLCSLLLISTLAVDPSVAVQITTDNVVVNQTTPAEVIAELNAKISALQTQVNDLISRVAALEGNEPNPDPDPDPEPTPDPTPDPDPDPPPVTGSRFEDLGPRSEPLPGLVGFGRFCRGGEGGRELHVTSLADDSSEGTLRWALELVNEPRIVKIDVPGVIRLQKDIRIQFGRLTLIGNDGGTTIRGSRFWVGEYDQHRGPIFDVIIRNISFRAPCLNGVPDNDCLTVYKVHRVVIDHCAFAGAADENLSFSHSTDCTAQYCSIEQAAVDGQFGANQPEASAHNFASMFVTYGDGDQYNGQRVVGQMTYYRCLFAHNNERMPLLVTPGGNVQIVGCVMYNWYRMFGKLECRDAQVIGNDFIIGPNNSSNNYPKLWNILASSANVDSRSNRLLPYSESNDYVRANHQTYSKVGALTFNELVPETGFQDLVPSKLAVEGLDEVGPVTKDRRTNETFQQVKNAYFACYNGDTLRHYSNFETLVKGQPEIYGGFGFSYVE